MAKTVCIVGVGLIGGSLAASLRRVNWCERIIGIDHNAKALNDAQALGIIDAGYASVDLCPDAPDVIIIAVPMSVFRQALVAIKPWLQKCSAITDVGSTKQSVLHDLQEIFGENIPPNFVAGHPIAGREKNGVLAAVDDLFINRKVILTPFEDTADSSLETVADMWEKVGAHVEHMGLQMHDKILAATSHLPHALAFALVNCLSMQNHTSEIFRYAAGGFADFTRIASSDPLVWRDICLANRDELLQAINEFDSSLKTLSTSLENNDGDSLEKLFADAKQARDQFCS